MNLFCCEAQMYLHITGLPSTAMEFCGKCKGERVEKLPDDPEVTRRVSALLERQAAVWRKI